MTLVIMGYDTRYSSKKHAEEYGRFDNRADCYRYLNSLRAGCLGEIIKFFVREISRDANITDEY